MSRLGRSDPRERCRWIGLLLVGVAAPACGQQGDPVAQVVAAERAFAARASEDGIPAAFLANLAETGVVFTPGPKNGREVYAGRSDSGALLSWWPVFADASAAGDLGYTTGPWSLAASRSQPASAFGTYFTIWGLDGGRWRVLVDLGVSGPAVEPGGEVVRPSPPGGDGPRASGVDLVEVDRRLGETPVVLERWAATASESVRVLRAGVPPATGRSALRADAASDVFEWTPAAGGVAESDDLGYTWGTYVRRTPGGSEERGNYLRAWRRDGGGVWRIAVEVLSPVPSGS